VFAGRFELIDPIGSGATGTVWRAWDRRLERLCAAKVLRQRHAGALLRFVREQGLRLDHPNVLSPYGWAADDDQALLAMDLVGGGSVSSLVADFGALPERYAAELLAQLLRALEQVHAAGLVHRDVKPANLLLETTGTAIPVLRLSDFGIALSLGEPRLTQHGAVVGTPGYVAPEALAGEPPSSKQDLYAVGVTAWQLLTGEEPPPTGPLPARPDTSPLWHLVESLTHPDPTQRPVSATTALETLTPVLATPLHTPAHTADGELIEVFDQLPPLPGPYGDLAAAAPKEMSAEAWTSTSRTSSSLPPAAELAPAEKVAPADEKPSAEPSADAQFALQHLEPVLRSTGTPVAAADSAGPRVPRRVVLGGVVALGLVVAGVAAVLALDGDPEGGGLSPETSPSVSSTPSSSPRTVPTGPVTRAPNAQLKVGEPCGWQEAGAVETTADGTRVECRQQGSSYLWIKV
jgi:serine/threonine-protein kinase